MYDDSSYGEALDKARNFYEEGLYNHATELLEEYLLEEPESYEGHLFYADCLYETQDFDKAASHYQYCLAQQPADVEPWLRLGAIYSQQGDYEKAIHYFSRAGELDPTCEHSFCSRIPCYQALGRSEDALAAFDQAQQLTEDCPDAHFHIGHVFFESGKLDLAIKHFERALWLDVTYPGARNMLAACYRAKQDAERAKEFYEEQLYYEEDDLDSLLGLAQLLIEDNKLNDAEPLIARAADHNPNSPQVDQVSAFLAYRQGDHEKAVRFLHQAIKKSPDEMNAWWNLANIFNEMGRARKARRAFERAVALAPEKKELLFEYVEFLFDQGRHEDASPWLDRLAQSSSGDPAYLNLQGIYHAERGSKSQAEKYFRRSMELEPKRSTAYLNLAKLLEDQGRTKKGLQLLEGFLAEQGNDPDVLERLGLLCLRLGQVQRALDLATSPLLDGLQKANLYEEAANYQFQRKNYRKAIMLARRALTFDDQRKNCVFLLGQCYENSRKFKEALGIYLQAQCLFPGEVWVLKRLGRLCERLKKTEAAQAYFGAAARRDALDVSSRQALERLRWLDEERWWSLRGLIGRFFGGGGE